MTDALRTWTHGRTSVVAAGWSWLAVATWFTSDALPGGLFGACFLLLAGVGIGFAWVVLSLRWLGDLWTWPGVFLWLTVPAVPVVAHDQAQTAWPMAVRVRLSESELRTRATAAHADGTHRPGRVGVFVVDSVSPEEHGTVVFTTAYAFFDAGGILYVPGQMPAFWVRPRVDLKHLYEPWYRWQIRD